MTTNLTRAAAPGKARLYKTDANLPKSRIVVGSQMLIIDKSDLREEIDTLLNGAAKNRSTASNF